MWNIWDKVWDQMVMGPNPAYGNLPKESERSRKEQKGAERSRKKQKEAERSRKKQKGAERSKKKQKEANPNF